MTSQPENHVDYMNRDLRARSLSSRLSLYVRQRQFALFVKHLQPDEHTRLLDLGVTPDNDLLESNFLEKSYPHLEQVTAASIEDASNLETEFPGLRFVQLRERRLPFADKEFDIAFSSAVIEHVGDRAQQREFLNELLRVADRVFFTTPNRWFPIELHTAIPVLHWLPQRFHQKTLKALGRHQWASTENLNLLSVRALRELLPGTADFVIHRQRLGPFCSNIIIWSTTR